MHGTGRPGDPIVADSACSQLVTGATSPLGAADKIMAVNGTTCYLAPVSSLPPGATLDTNSVDLSASGVSPLTATVRRKPLGAILEDASGIYVDTCQVAQNYFLPGGGAGASVPTNTGAYLVAVVPDGAGGWLCRYVNNSIGVTTPVYGGTGSPPAGQGSNTIALQPGGAGLTLTAGPGMNVDTNSILSPGLVTFNVRDSNVAWAFPGAVSAGGSNIYIDPTTRRLYGEPPHMELIPIKTGSQQPTTTVSTIGSWVATDVARTQVITNPSTERIMRVTIAAHDSGFNATGAANADYSVTTLFTITAGAPTARIAFPGPSYGQSSFHKDASMSATTQRVPARYTVEGIYDLAPGASMTVQEQNFIFIFSGGSVQISPPAWQYFYGMIVTGRTL